MGVGWVGAGSMIDTAGVGVLMTGGCGVCNCICVSMLGLLDVRAELAVGRRLGALGANFFADLPD